jgi:alpha-galactosidase
MKLSRAFVSATVCLVAVAFRPIVAVAAAPPAADVAAATAWTARHFGGDAPVLPFSFAYGDARGPDVLRSWQFASATRSSGPATTERVLTWTDPRTKLVVRCVVVEYRDFPAVEWTVSFQNTGTIPTPVLANIQALDADVERGPEGEFVLHGTKGDWCTADSFAPFSRPLPPLAEERFASYGGRPCNAAFPFFNLQRPGGGVFIAVGWPGQWAGSFVRDAGDGLHVTAGQQVTHLSLEPGEQIRSPLVALVFWRGDDVVASHNLWRRWMVAHNLPRTADGRLPPTQIVACSSHQYKEMTQATEENQKMFIDRYLAEGMKLDSWWMDAGWYPCGGEWVNTGTWEPDASRFPRGLRAVSDHARAKGIGTIVWFEPERVGDPRSWIATQHPEWLLSTKGETPKAPEGGGFGSGPGSLLNLGNPAALAWLIDHVDRTLTEQGIDLYRQDFNIDPLPFWVGADSEDRRGMTENLYVQGYLAYWDALRQRHPNLRIDSCASGGRRNDLETLRRAVPLIRTDFLFEPTSQQNHHFAYASWIPYHGAGYVTGKSAIGLHGDAGVETYGFRSNMSPSLTLCYDMRDTSLNFPLAADLFRQLKRVQPEYLGDFHPLTPPSLGNDAWLAWQYDRPEAGSGVVQAFRRPASTQSSARFTLHGLVPDATYEVENLDGGKESRTGRALMEEGLEVTLDAAPAAAVIAYRREP